jgi:hypothetical protein
MGCFPVGHPTDNCEDSPSISSHSSVVDETSECDLEEEIAASGKEETDIDEVEIIEKPSKKRTRGMF